ncbi:MAG TPA: glucose-6-phosphate dehydrogenase assembly protein OpcA [Acidimicrobiales bacterium]|nr:glucose-6-phosphate dehydrogenase assembly protein OpcA [Acidimicrobiales bacterium]
MPHAAVPDAVVPDAVVPGTLIADAIPPEELEYPLAVQTWEKPDVSLGEVIAALPELRRRASGREAGTRTAVMTLVMVIGPDDDPEEAAAPVRSLGAHHPCRAVVLRPELDSTPVIDAKAYLWRAEPAASAGHPVFFEELHLHVGGQAASHLASIVGPFVLADLPVVTWFPGVLPDPTDPLLRLATAVVVDTRVVPPGSAAVGHSYRTLLELANHRPVVDLSWVRLRPWRELMAGLFEPEHCRRFQDGVRLAQVQGKTGPRHILGGWLLAQLDLRARELVLGDSRHVNMSVEAAYDGEEGKFEVVRDGDARVVWARATLSNGVTQSQALPLPDDSLTSALSDAISNLRPDRVWERALAAAAALAS